MLKRNKFLLAGIGATLTIALTTGFVVQDASTRAAAERAAAVAPEEAAAAHLDRLKALHAEAEQAVAIADAAVGVDAAELRE